MNYIKLLNLAGVPENLHTEAVLSLTKANHMAKGLILSKWKVRLFQATKISELLEWKDERLLDKHPELASWDIAPMINITANGDNALWGNQGPEPGQWLNDDPTSAEYKLAVSKNFWCKGEHPRSRKARKAWYRRNAGEHEAWRRGEKVSVNMEHEIWSTSDDCIKVQRCGSVWFIKYTRKVLGLFNVTTRLGYEIDNVIRLEPDETGVKVIQLWYPIPYHELRAPVTKSTLPGR